mmetsp:Transcript_12525/g.27317  ORF Transcript_12525/g.27317 Transcript_12525/m.27317 type:complete len:235 (-) Transcript_12525:3-707(-)
MSGTRATCIDSHRTARSAPSACMEGRNCIASGLSLHSPRIYPSKSVFHCGCSRTAKSAMRCSTSFLSTPRRTLSFCLCRRCRCRKLTATRSPLASHTTSCISSPRKATFVGAPSSLVLPSCAPPSSSHTSSTSCVRDSTKSPVSSAFLTATARPPTRSTQTARSCVRSSAASVASNPGSAPLVSATFECSCATTRSPELHPRRTVPPLGDHAAHVMSSRLIATLSHPHVIQTRE